MGLTEDSDKLGKQMHDKREAAKRTKATAEAAAKKQITKQKQHEQDKREGMI